MNQHASDGVSLPTFAQLGVPAVLCERLAQDGITAPFPIQAASLPDSLAGRDVLGRGRTGSGKTLAFSLALLNTLIGSERRRAPHAPRALVLVPTRELAQQVADVVSPLAHAARLRTMTIYGGVSYNGQRSALRRGVDIVIATPGRLEDLLASQELHLASVEVTVLDEADHMADLGFLPAVKRILDATPSDAQRLLFSATLDGAVGELVRRYLTDPVSHEVDPGDADVPVMTHHVFTVDGRDKAEVIRQLVEGEGRTVAFTRTKHGAKNLARRLTLAGIPAVDLHGNLSQAVRQKNLGRFASGRVRVLVATDIAARGIHVDDVNLVVHVDPPAEAKAYVQRSGRPARAGNEGVVVTVATPAQNGSVRSLMKQAGIKPVMRPVGPGHRAIGELVGPVAPRVEPSAEPAPEPTPQRSARPARGPRREGGGAPGGQRPARGPHGRRGPGAKPGQGSASRSGQGEGHGGQGPAKRSGQAPNKRAGQGPAKRANQGRAARSSRQG
jgi:superfamily II DNA/RNA helicase